MHSLPLFMNLRGQPVLLLGDGEGAAPKKRLLELAGAVIVDEPAAATRIAVLAIDDYDSAAAHAERLRSLGLLVNAVDKPALCDFSFPAIVDRAPVTLAIGTGGASASLAKAVRERMEALLPATLGAVASAARTMRAEVNTRLTTASDRRQFWDRLMAPGAPLDPLAPAADPVVAIRDALAEPSGPDPAPYSIRPVSDDPDDLTLRDLRHLSQADILYVQSGASPDLAGRARRDAERVSFGERGEISPVGRCVILYRHDRSSPIR